MYVSLLLGPPPGLGVVRGIEEDAENDFKVRIRIIITILLKLNTINILLFNNHLYFCLRCRCHHL